MGKERSDYRRKLSAEEARERYLFVAKDALGFFPPLGQPFELSVHGSTLRLELTAVDCCCVGSPHQHYRIEAGELAGLVEFSRGTLITITRGNDGGYSLTLGH